MKLPAQLAPWSAWLALLPDHLAAPLGEMLLRLQPLVGRMAGLAPGPDRTPVGVGGISRRGPYHRLLLSEWAVLDAAPDEFLRRAAAGELLFGAPEPQVQRRARTCVALFDAGPAQLGEPRLVHLALFILLARRAHDEGASFGWGILQTPGPLHADCGQQALFRLMSARTLLRAGAAARDGWNGLLAGIAPHAELWQVGAPEAVALRRESARATIGQALSEDGLQVGITQQGRARHMLLDLPAPASAVRLLRFPGGEPAKPARNRMGGRDTPSLKHAPRFTIYQDHVVTGRPDGGTLSFSYLDAHAAIAPAPRRQRAPKRGSVLGIWPLSHGVADVAACGETLIFRHFGGAFERCECARPPAQQFAAARGPGRWLPTFFLHKASFDQVLMIDSAARLVGWSARRGATGATSFALVAGGVVGAVQCQNRLLYASVADGHTRLYRYESAAPAPVDDLVFEWPVLRVLYGEVSSLAPEHMLGLQVSGTEWLLVHGRASRTLAIGDGATVIGVARLASDSPELALLVINPDRCTVELRGATQRRTILHAHFPIAHLTLDPSSQIISWLLSGSHELFVRRLHSELALLHYTPPLQVYP
ncbi:hypothetical protein F2P45_09090 [Massilia sp. CCM 8733]|uniref:Uncharacterized protein n=1 Tax=Massilia mucilaginosa TaxID=2609282 RepID=A0ABX0NQW1_9BURK|nr:hypothetical protein [Massilia mucilaginosa]NHZ89170.1 hypothetical protein [Massilia mucilaginosa]